MHYYPDVYVFRFYTICYLEIFNHVAQITQGIGAVVATVGNIVYHAAHVAGRFTVSTDRVSGNRIPAGFI